MKGRNIVLYACSITLLLLIAYSSSALLGSCPQCASGAHVAGGTCEWDDGCGGCSKCGSCTPGVGCALSDADSLFDDVVVYCTEKFADCCEGTKRRHYTSDLSEELDCGMGCYAGTTAGCAFTSQGYTCHADPACSKTQCGAQCETNSDCPSGFACDTSTCSCASNCAAGCAQGVWQNLAPIDQQTYVGWFYTCTSSTTPFYSAYFGRISTCDYNSYKFQLGKGETLTSGILKIQGTNPSSYAGICVTQDAYHGLTGWAGFCGDLRTGGCSGFAGMDGVATTAGANTEVTVVYPTGNYNKGSDALGNALAAISVGETKGPFKHYQFNSFLGCVETSTTSTTTSLTASTTVSTVTTLPSSTTQPGSGTTSIPSTTIPSVTTTVPSTTTSSTTSTTTTSTSSTSTTSTTTVPGPSIESVSIPESNKASHHTDQYTNSIIVLRRAASFMAKVDVKDYVAGTHELLLKLGDPDGGTLEPSVQATPSYDSWGFSCSQSSSNPPITSFDCRVDIKRDAKVGLYSLKAELIEYGGGATTLVSSKAGPGFYVIFNPWSQYDSDVYYANTGELGYYVLGGAGYNYYYGSPIYLGGRVDYQLHPFHDKIFTTAINAVSGQSSGQSSANLIRSMVRSIMFYNHCEEYWQESECNAHSGCVPANTPPHCGPKPRTTDPDAGLCFSYSQSTCATKNYCVWATKLCHYRPNSYNYGSTLGIDPAAPMDPGQCMDFANFLVAYLRSVGIPSRPITTILVDSWNFHDWAEARLPAAISGDRWGLMDSTPGYDMNAVPPSSVWKDGNSLYEPDSDEARVYSYDASVGVHPSDLKCVHYESCGGPSPKRVLAGSCPLNVFVSAGNVTVGGNATIVYGFGNPTAQNVSLTYNLTVAHYSDELQGSRSNSTIYLLYVSGNLTLAGNDSVNRTEAVGNTLFIGGGYNIVSLEANNSCNNESSFRILPGLNLSVDAPSKVSVNESFNITVTVGNTLTSNVSNLTVSLLYPAFANVSSNTSFTISELCAGCTNLSRYIVYLSSAGTYPFGAQVYSADGGFVQTLSNVVVSEPARVFVLLSAPSRTANGSSFTVSATVSNVGGLNASNNTAVINWTSGFTSSDSLSESIPLLEAGANNTLTWNLSTIEAGIHALSVQVSNATSSLTNASTLVLVYSGTHNLSVNASVSEVYNNKTSQSLNITLSNNGDSNETLRLRLYASPRSILFSVYDNATILTGNSTVTVPAHSSKKLALNASTSGGVAGNITVHLSSALDPSTEASVRIQVTTPVQTRSLSLTTSWNLVSIPLNL